MGKKLQKLLGMLLVLAISVCSLSTVMGVTVTATDTGVTYDYSALEDKLRPHIKDYYETFNMYDGVGLELRNGALVTDLDWWWQLKMVDGAVEFTPPYAIFNIEKNTTFTATFTETTDISKLGCFVSRDMVTWHEGDFDIIGKTIVISALHSVSFVKLVWSQDNNRNMGLSSVTYTKALNTANVRRYDYKDVSGGNPLGNGYQDASILKNRGVWESNGLYLESTGIIRPNWEVLNRSTSPNSYNGYATYKVQPGTRFGLTVTSNKTASSAAARLGYENELEWNIEIYGSSDNINFQRLNVFPVYSAGYANNQGMSDARRRADWNFIVPEDIVYIKCKFPITQNLSTQTGEDDEIVWPYIGNDLFEIDCVEFTALKYDYYQATEGDYYIEGAFNNDTKANFGINFYGGGFARCADGRFDADWSWQNTHGHAGTYVIYNVKPGTAFYAEFYMNWEGAAKQFLDRDNYVIKFYGSNSREVGDWTEITTLVNADTYVQGKKYYTATISAVQNVYQYIKIEWPAKLSSSITGNDVLKLEEVAFTEYFEDAPEYANGDLNGDGAINILDYIVLKKILSGLGEATGADPDLNGNGQINAVDFILLRKFLLGAIETI